MILTVVLAFALGMAVAAYSQSRSDRADLISLLGLSAVYGLAAVQTAAFWAYHFNSAPWAHGALWILLAATIAWLVRHTDRDQLLIRLRRNFSWLALIIALILLVTGLLSKALIYADMPSPRGDDVKRHGALIYLFNHLDAVPRADQMEGYVWDLYPVLGFHVLLAALNDIMNLLSRDLICCFVVLLPVLFALAIYILCRRALSLTAAMLGLVLALFFTRIPNAILYHSNYTFFLGMVYAATFVGTLIVYLRDGECAELPGLALSLTGLFTSGSFTQEFLLSAPALGFLFLALRRPRIQTILTLALIVIIVVFLGWPELAYFYHTGRTSSKTDSRGTIQMWGIYGPIIGGVDRLPFQYGYVTSLLFLCGVLWAAGDMPPWKRRPTPPSRTTARGLILWVVATLGFAILSSTYYVPLPGIFYSRGYKQVYSALLPIAVIAAQGGATLLGCLARPLPRGVRLAGVILLVSICLVYGLYTDVRFWYPERIEPILHPNGRQMLEWMNTHLTDGDIVLNNFFASDTSSWIPAFTGNRAVIASKGNLYPNTSLKHELRYNVGTNPNGYRALELLEALDVSYVYVGGHRKTLSYERDVPPFNPAELIASPYYELVAQDGNNFLFATQLADNIPEGYMENAQTYSGHQNPLFHWLTLAHFASIRSDHAFFGTDGTAEYDIWIQAGPRGGPLVLRMSVVDATAHHPKTLYGRYIKSLNLQPFELANVQVTWNYPTKEVTFTVDGHTSPPDVTHPGGYDAGFEYVVGFGLAESIEARASDQYEVYVYLWEDFTRSTSVPPDVEHPLAVSLDNQVTLAGYDLSGTTVHAGETVTVTLYWQAQAKMDHGYTVFVHLFDPENAQIWGQHDAQPHGGNYPTDWWIEDEVVTDTVAFQVDPRTPPGEYALLTGMYWLPTGERLPLADGTGNSVLLTTVRVEK
jgi:hypothetical protein